MDPRKVQQQYKANRKDRKEMLAMQLYIAAQVAALLEEWRQPYLGRWIMAQK